MHKQSDAPDEVNVATAKLDRTMQRDTSLIEQSAAAKESLYEEINVFGVA
ncbi:hypothetical protein [Paraburkholderia adhaesiva]|nr:hypothetical protein [Paraburkholderia adhaesiva]